MIVGCSVKKNTGFSRFWHRTNTHYNGWFNGNEAIKTGIQDVTKARKDDFNRIIPVYEYGASGNWSAMSANADRAIKKAVIMIKKHSMLINGKQYNKWIDDCYLLMGKAHYFKMEYSIAVGQLRYVSENSEKQFTKDEAKIWMIRCYNELNEFPDAGTAIRQVEKDNLDKRLKGPYYATIADYYIRQKEWENGIEALKIAIIHTKRKKTKARYHFIIGQLQQELGNNKEAYNSYQTVLSNKPEYELEFQSKLRLAQTSENQSNEGLRKLLKKMLKDGKNLEYQDQIYYAIALIDLKEEKKEDGIVNLKKSINASTGNNTQKALSYLKLAELYFADREYEPAQAYYDSTSVLLDKQHPRYDEVIRLKENLTLVVQNIRTVTLQDSLQKLGKMNETELVSYLENYVEELKIKDEENKNNQNNAINFNNNLNNQGKWYFYNQQTLSFGINDFRKIWGNRPLEDDWRRQNKTSTTIVENGESDTTEQVNPRYDINTYLAEIPRTDSAYRVSNEMIYQALYDLGLVYKERIFDYARSVEAFEELVKRNTTNKHFPITYYQLYLVYTQLQNQAKADEYKNILIAQYPESEYTKMLVNPDYFANLDEANDEAEPLYTQAYNFYKSGLYSQSSEMCTKAMKDFPETKLAHRFALLSALCTGKMESEQIFIVALESVKKNYSGTESASTADRLLQLLKGVSNVNPTITNDTVSPYKYEASAEHMVVLVIEDPAKKLDEITAQLASYHDKNFMIKGLGITNTLMGKKYQVLLVRKFLGANDALQYYKTVIKDNLIEQFKITVKTYFFPISMTNYATLYKRQDVEGYNTFFMKNYTVNP